MNEAAEQFSGAFDRKMTPAEFVSDMRKRNEYIMGKFNIGLQKLFIADFSCMRNDFFRNWSSSKICGESRRSSHNHQGLCDEQLSRLPSVEVRSGSGTNYNQEKVEKSSTTFDTI